jgi:hypothetical protein
VKGRRASASEYIERRWEFWMKSNQLTKKQKIMQKIHVTFIPAKDEGQAQEELKSILCLTVKTRALLL